MLRPMRMIRLLRVVPVVLLVLGVAACGSDGAEDVTAKSPTPTATPDEMVSCGGDTAWPASAMTDRLPNSQSGDLLAALEEFAADGSPDLPPLLRDATVADADWFVLARDGHAATVATGPWSATGPGRGAQVMYLDNEGGWKVTSWGDCSRLQPFLDDGAQWVEIGGVQGSRDTAHPTLLISEVSCTGGRDPRPHLREPTIVETPDRVTVAWTSDAISGMATCVGAMPVPAELALNAPLGDRTLYDGSVWPAKKVG